MKKKKRMKMNKYNIQYYKEYLLDVFKIICDFNGFI